jgi:dolichol-phosphate mannosyltransferase
MPIMPSPTNPVGDGRVLVITPTYNEIESLERTLDKLFAAVPSVHVLVVDDASPDGTGELADRLAAADPRVSVLHRTAKNGLGQAYLAGFAWAHERNYEYVVEMDADGSHPASALPAMLAAVAADPACGVAIGSRWIPGGSVVDWPVARWLLSRGANVYARLALGIPVHDITAGFRAYREQFLASILSEEIDSRGYCFQIDMTIRAVDAGWSVVEVPIEFREREAGVSKMSRSIVVEAMSKVTVWGIRRRWGGTRPSTRISAQTGSESPAPGDLASGA